MMSEFSSQYAKFKSNESSLPESIRIRLNYIASKILKQRINLSEFSEEVRMEIKELEFLDDKTLQIIFSLIFHTLALDNIEVAKKCLAKRKGLFRFWGDSTIEYQQYCLVFKIGQSIKKYQYEHLQLINIRRSRGTFDILYKQTYETSIKFIKEDSFVSNLRTIEERISLKKKDRLQEHSKVEWENSLAHQQVDISVSKIEGKQKQPVQKIDQKENNRDENDNNRSSVQERHNSFLAPPQHLIQTESPKYQLTPPDFGYIICISKDNFLASVHQNQPKLRIQILLSLKQPLQRLLSCFVQQKGWNSQIVDEEMFQCRSEKNTIEMYRSYKSISFLTSQRQTSTKIVFSYLDSTNALLIESPLPMQSYKEKHVRSVLNCKVHAAMFEQGTKITIISDYNAQGFCHAKDSQEMLVKMFQDLVFFENYYKFCLIKNTEILTLFQGEPQLKKAVESSQEKEFVEKEFISQNNLQNSKTEPSLGNLIGSKDNLDSSTGFMQLMPQKPSEIPSKEYMELVKNRQFQKYYLQKVFSQCNLPCFDHQTPWYCLKQLLAKGGQYQISHKKQLIFINQSQIQAQKATLMFIIKQIGSNILSGKNIMNISLPVDIFESRSLLERGVASFGLAPDYLCPLANETPLKQIKNIVTFIASLPTLQLIMQKPFNPILGQTFQAYVKGIPIYYEQISHHPPISAYFMKCNEFVLHGNLNAFADVGVNSAVGGNMGVMHIQFPNGTHYECYFPPCEISGLIYGPRKFRAYGRGYVFERKQRLFAEFSIQKPKKGVYEKRQKEQMLPGDIIGGIYKVTPQFIQTVSKMQNIRKFNGLSKEHIESKLAAIRGVWFQQIFIDQQVINKDVKIYPVQYNQVVLPSDSNFRLDILHHKEHNLELSQLAKETLENLQRADRKLREKAQKERKKRK